MFVFGHLGIGNKIASPWKRNLPRFPLFLGMLLPDLIDKPLFYGCRLLDLRIDLISCTRTFGHTALFLFALLILAQVLRSRWIAALSLGMATHLLLDCVLDRFSRAPSSALTALSWPFLNHRFADFPFSSMADHARHLLTSPIIVSEVLGLALIGWDYWKSTHRSSIARALSSRRARIWIRKRSDRL